MWFWYSLGAAVFGALSVIVNKRTLRKVSPETITWALFAFPIPILLLLAFREGLPHINVLFFVGTLGSSLSFVTAKFLSLEAMKKGALSKIYPLNAFNAVIPYIFGLIVFGEIISFEGVLGLVLIIAGTYLLNADKIGKGLMYPLKVLAHDSASLLFLIASFLAGASAIFDKLGLQNTFPTNAALTIFVENSAMTILLSLFMLKRNRGCRIEIKNSIKDLIVASALYAVLTLLVFTGFANGPVALVIGVKKTQVLLVLLLSFFLFGDKPGKHTLVATILMLAGVVMVKIS